MKLDELKHVLRASAAIANENSMVVVGSQAILLLVEQPPESILVSRDFVRELLREGLISFETLSERIAMLDASKYPVTPIQQWAERRLAEAKAAP